MILTILISMVFLLFIAIICLGSMGYIIATDKVTFDAKIVKFVILPIILLGIVLSVKALFLLFGTINFYIAL